MFPTGKRLTAPERLERECRWLAAFLREVDELASQASRALNDPQIAVTHASEVQALSDAAQAFRTALLDFLVAVPPTERADLTHEHEAPHEHL